TLPVQQLLAPTPPNDLPAAETTVVLVKTAALRLEQIVSYGRATPSGEWYDPTDAEWVMLLRGEAVLEFADGAHLRLNAGEAVTLPAHRRHRVANVSDDAVWLALHFPASAAPGAILTAPTDAELRRQN